MSSSKADTPAGQPVIKTRRFSVSLVWIVPIVAVLVGISLVIHSVMQQGPTIVLNFKTGSGLVANKTEVKYRNVVIGQLTADKMVIESGLEAGDRVVLSGQINLVDSTKVRAINH